jgi:transposase InsO family protein
VEHYDEGVSKDSRRVDIDGLEEARCAALVQSARYLEGIRRYHDRNAKERSFNVGDLVLRRIQNTEGLHKAKLPVGRSLHSRNGDRAGLLPPSDTRRRRRQQLVECRPALSVLRLVYTTTLGLKSTRLHQDPSAVSGLRVWALVSGLLPRYKRPPGPGISLQTTPLQNPVRTATYGSWAATSDRGL